MKEYKTIKNEIVKNTIVIEKSKFIGYAKGVESVEDATDFIASIKKLHFDATHNCSAYIYDDKAKFSDDGEPQGTAGMPIYECIKNKGLNKVAVVVTRYFGGIKLGAGGLVRAYNNCASEVLNIAEVVEFCDCVLTEIVVDYNLLAVAKKQVESLAIVKDVVYDANVTLVCLVLAEKYNTLCDIVVDTTNGKAEILEKDRLICPFN